MLRNHSAEHKKNISRMMTCVKEAIDKNEAWQYIRLRYCE